MRKRTGVVIMATGTWLAMAGCQCSPGGGPAPAPEPDAGTACELTDLGSRQIEDPCSPSSCGGNSPFVNTFPINGLHPDGCKNVDGAKLRIGLKIMDTPCERLSHGVVPYLDYALVDDAVPGLGYELVARDPTSNTTLCRGEDLVGVTFEVDVEKQAAQQSTTEAYRIAHVARTSARTFTSSQSGCQGKPGTTDSPRVVYFITPAGSSQSVCVNPPKGEDHNVPTIILHQPHKTAHSPGSGSDAEPLGNLDEVLEEDLPSYAMIVPGAVYNFRAGLIAKSFLPNAEPSGSSGPVHGSHRWFNIACAKDALAQTELLGLAHRPPGIRKSTNSGATQVPVSNSERLARERLPALHMLTAKYCDGLSATTRGTPVAWHWKDWASHRSISNDLPVEAVWGEDGAVCVNHSRLWLKNKVVFVPQSLYDLFKDMAGRSFTEQEFLKVICPSRKPLGSQKPDGQLTEGIVQKKCSYADDDLVSRVPGHSEEDNGAIITVF